MSKTPRDQLFDTLCRRIEAFGLPNVDVKATAVIDRLMAQFERMVVTMSDAEISTWMRPAKPAATAAPANVARPTPPGMMPVQTIRLSIMSAAPVDYEPASGWQVIDQTEERGATTLTLRRNLTAVGGGE